MSDAISALAVRLVQKAVEGLFKSAKSKLSPAVSKWRNEQQSKKLAEKITAAAKVKTFWQRDKAVDLRQFYYPTKISYGPNVNSPMTAESPAHGSPPIENRSRAEGLVGSLEPHSGLDKTIKVNSLADLLLDEHLVIEGIVGQGKSTFLRYLCVQELSERGSGRIPVFVELRTISDEGLQSLLKMAMQKLDFEIDDELFEYYANSGKFVFLLDAFDEISEGFVSRATIDLEDFCERFSATQVIVTARPESAIQQSRFFRVIRICPLTTADQEPFLRRIGMDEARAKIFANAIQNSSSRVTGLLTTPLVLTLLSTLYQTDNVIPADIPEFYERLFYTLMTRHDASKPAFRRVNESKLDEISLHKLFCAFCFVVMNRNRTPRIKLRDFNLAFEEARKIVGISCEGTGFRHDITRIACLMIEEGIEFEFLHQSVMEYHVAAFIRTLPDQDAKRMYHQMAQLETRFLRWRQVINFLRQIDKNRYMAFFEIPSIDRALEAAGVDIEKSTYNRNEATMRLLGDCVTVLCREGEVVNTDFGQFAPVMSPYVHPLREELLFQVRRCFREYDPSTLRGDVIPFQTHKIWNDCFDDDARSAISEVSAAVIDACLRERIRFFEFVERESERRQLLQLE